MPRAVLTLLLCLCASAALANPVVANNDDACPTPKQGKTAAPANGNGGDTDAEPPRSTGASTTRVPTRVGTPHVVAPRWHSLLPGMFR
jgi:hypothetical protein